MKQNLVEAKGSITLKLKQAAAPPPSPPLPPKPILAIKPLFKRVTVSITNEEIAKFWRQRRMVEEDHFLAAIKAAARIKARNLSEEDYNYFEESLKEDDEPTKKDETYQEIRVGIKDWWTKSKYAYLNQPVIETNIKPKRRSTYIPNLCFYKPAYRPTHVSFGIC